MSDICCVCALNPLKSTETRQPHPLILRVTCDECGVYDIAHKFIAGEKNGPSFWTDERRLRVSRMIRSETDAKGRFADVVLSYETAGALIELH
jgi:hypothetical protein